MARKIKPLTKKEKNALKEVLVQQKNNLIFKGVYLSDDFNVNDEDRRDEVDQANADVCNAQRLRFRNRENFYEKKLDQALKRMDEGTYGQCEECGAHIGFKRLSARPTAELCIICKEESERDESLSIFGRKSKSLGNRINLVSHI